MSARKVGGITFLRLGRLQLSFCVCRSSAGMPADFGEMVATGSLLVVPAYLMLAVLVS